MDTNQFNLIPMLAKKVSSKNRVIAFRPNKDSYLYAKAQLNAQSNIAKSNCSKQSANNQYC